MLSVRTSLRLLTGCLLVSTVGFTAVSAGRASAQDVVRPRTGTPGPDTESAPGARPYLGWSSWSM
jgi:hypothetical protein